MQLITWLIVMVFAGDRIPAPVAPADPAARDRAPHAALITAAEVRVAVVSVNGAAAPEAAIRGPLGTYRRYLRATPRLIFSPPRWLEGPLDHRPTYPQLTQLLRGSAASRPHDITVVIWPRRFFLDYSAYYQMLTIDGVRRQVVVMHAPLQLPVPRGFTLHLWSQVLLHELCHALHVPAEASRLWQGVHCTRADCVLYPSLDPRSAWMLLMRWRRPWSLCDRCTAEVQALLR